MEILLNSSKQPHAPVNVCGLVIMLRNYETNCLIFCTILFRNFAVQLTSLREPLVDISYRLVVHLLRAVEHVDHNTESSSQILGSLCFACPSRARRGSRHRQMEGLGQRDVTPTGQSGSKLKHGGKLNLYNSIQTFPENIRALDQNSQIFRWTRESARAPL